MFNLSFLKNFFDGLKNYDKPVLKNHKPAARKTIVPKDVYDSAAPWSGIVIHHSATKDGKGNDWAAIKRYHTSYRIDGNIVDKEAFDSRRMLGHGKSFEKPWTDVGYHGGWELDGGVYVFKIGRPWYKPGAHAGIKGNNTFNEKYLGLCIIGNLDNAEPPKELWDLCVSVTKEICETLNIPKDKVIGHREVYDAIGIPRQKTCPGNRFDMAKFRGEIL